MIIQNPQTFALTGPDPNDPSHPTVTVSTNDPRWYQLYTVMGAQAAVVTPNQQAHDNYINQLSAYQTSVNAGRGAGLTPPTKPMMTAVDDLGNTSQVPFVPPLPDPVAQPAPTPAMPGGVDPSTRPADPNIVLAAHTQILLGIQATLAKIAAKLQVS